MLYKPRWYQDEAVEAVFDLFNELQGYDEEGKPRRVNPLICLPTGTGKSLVIALIIMRAMQAYPQTRPIMGTHVKELVEQNAEKLASFWPGVDMGIYAAGLKRKEHENPVVYGSIQSMAKKFNDEGKTIFGFRDFLIVDEAHLISPNADTQYLAFITALQQINPWLKVIGLSATPFRMGLGHLTEGNMFTHVAYNLCTIEGFGRLLAEGFIAPIFPRPTETNFDLSGVGMRQGDYQPGALEKAVDKSDVTYGAVNEMIKYGWNRRAWLVFASGIDHAEHIAEAMRVHGVPAAAVHSKLSPAVNDERIAAFKRGELRCLVNKDKLTTGFDHPPIDLVGMMRPTMSTGLWVQMLGRATRPAPNKNDALVLDFAGNTPRLGPINDPVIPKPRKKGDTPGESPIKICPECQVYNHSSVRVCAACQHEFPVNTDMNSGLSTEAGTAELMREEMPEAEWCEVDRVILVNHVAKSGKKFIKACYYTGMRTFFEYITVEDGIHGLVKKKGRDWVRQRANSEPPEWSNDLVIQNAHNLRIPNAIKVWTNKKPYPEIISYDFEERTVNETS